mgnify:CR=1 FL=1
MAEAEDAGAQSHPFTRLLGGVRGALESILPPLVFITVYLALGGDSSTALTWAIVAAIGLALVFTVWRIIEGKHPAPQQVIRVAARNCAKTGVRHS